MSKIFFKNDPNRETEALAQSLSLMFLIPVSNFKAEDVWAPAMKTSVRLRDFQLLNCLPIPCVGSREFLQ